ncbi:glycerol-3-phosphate dehydrogenase/oxidase [Bacillus massiliigorillae]|uniref:glycerol-3-phosphate dehydrogenase/oxidase n=1 Tax=Bacillus massiliigorillae TaxID=1243664 RepID=UPI0003A85349|nr:FAD-dependent oxidoreductase [Bacillus massiliigorillae]
MSFTNLNRDSDLQKMSSKQYDVLIIGGGITGAGIALDAVTRGMNVALCEMHDFASGTSSRSTKLIHGGLRYLKNLDVKVVAEVGKERAIVYENGPHITSPEWMILPFFEGGTFGSTTTSLGLKLYDFLANVDKKERRKMLSKEAVLQKEPLLKQEGLKGGGLYVEYRTDDARLTIEVIKKAVEYGADCVNYLQVQAFLYENKRIVGVKVKDSLSGKIFEIKAKKIVNATGPWGDRLREMDQSKLGKTLQLTKGVHIVIDQSRFPLKQAIYFDTEDGRMIFAIPRNHKTYVGTTDTFYNEEKINPVATLEDLSYLISATNTMFPSIQLTLNDIESSWAGVRPLIHEIGKKPSEISRKDEVWVSPSGLITIAGGKLTGYRRMAEIVVDGLASQFCKERYKLFSECQTVDFPISGGDVGGSQGYILFLKENIEAGIQMGFTEREAHELTRVYGSNVSQVFQLIVNHQHEVVKYSMSNELYGKLAYAINHERIATPVDFFFRRTGALLFHIKWVQKWKEVVIQYMADKYNWNENIRKRYVEELEDEIECATHTNKKRLS